MHMPTPLRWRGGVGWGEKGGEERGEKKMFEKEEIGGNKKKGGGGSGGRCGRGMRGCSGAALGTYRAGGAGVGRVILFLIIVAGCVGAEVSTSLGELC